MFNRFKKFFNPQQSRPADWKDLVYKHAQQLVKYSDFGSDFIGYHSKLEDVEGRSDLCQIVMTNDGYKAIRPFEKEALYVKDTPNELWDEFLLPHLIKCKEYIDKQMKQPFIDICYKKFIELNPNLTTNK